VEPFPAVGGHVSVRQEGTGAAQTRTDLSHPVTFDAVFSDLRVPMVRLAHVITGSNEVGEEIVQEAFMRLHRRWADVENPPAFLRTVVTNLCRTEVRRSRLMLGRAQRTVDTTMGAPELDETWAAVCRLPFRQRAVIALRYYADLPETEIASILGCRIGTVKSARHRAIARLRKEIS
jgi:RNA polymerase sigma factor (sigma-70 family)